MLGYIYLLEYTDAVMWEHLKAHFKTIANNSILLTTLGK